MIDRTSPAYQAAKDRVKVSHFTEKGHDITGLVHVGANDGYEVGFYLEMGIRPILCFEPLLRARREFTRSIDHGRDSDVWLLGYALGNIDASASIQITPGDAKGSSFLPLPSWDVVVAYEDVFIRRFSHLVLLEEIDVAKYNCLVVDVQGMELDVLRGMDSYLDGFNFLSIECSLKPIYRGEAPADEVIAFLDKRGFQQDSPTCEHDDIMFINRRVL